MIIGIAGTIGAGKGTVVKYLKNHGFAHYSSSDILKEMLQEQGLPQTRLELSKLADELSKQYEGGILQLSHEHAKKDGVKDYILEAIHRESEADYIRKLGGVVLGVDADIRERYQRSVKRQEGEKDNVTYEEFVVNSEREDDGKGSGAPNIRAVEHSKNSILRLKRP